jgi:hypothetical protein
VYPHGLNPTGNSMTQRSAPNNFHSNSTMIGRACIPPLG